MLYHTHLVAPEEKHEDDWTKAAAVSVAKVATTGNSLTETTDLDPGEGAYFTYRPAAMGQCHFQWAKKKPTDGSAVVFAKPGKKVPGFKFTSNGGKTELGTNCDQKQNFYTCLSLFLKEMVLQWEIEEIVILAQVADKSIQIPTLRVHSNEIKRYMEVGEVRAFDREIACLGVVSPSEGAFQGVETMEPMFFMEKAKSLGWGINMW